MNAPIKLLNLVIPAILLILAMVGCESETCKACKEKKIVNDSVVYESVAEEYCEEALIEIENSPEIRVGDTIKRYHCE